MNAWQKFYPEIDGGGFFVPISYYVFEADGTHVMTAPLHTIQQHYDLHADALRRIERECAPNTEAVCILHFGDKEKGGVKQVMVRRLPEVMP